MKNIFSLFILSLGCLVVQSCSSGDPDMILNVDMSSHEAEVPASMYGIFFEEINHAGDGGLYGELLMNRSFDERLIPEGYHVEEGKLMPPAVINHLKGEPTVSGYKWGDDPFPGWKFVKNGKAEASFDITTEQPNYASAPQSLKVDVKNIGDGISLINEGYWGIALQKGASYRLRMFVRNVNGKEALQARLLDGQSKELASAGFRIPSDGKWHEYNAVVESKGTVSNARLSLDLSGAGTYYFDYVSLFPVDTYKGRENGMRKDVAEMLEGLHPAFIRWPGGCIVEGISLSNRVEWKKTLGDPAARPGQYSTWGYHNTYGFGYKEFLDFCEDIGAKGMFVCNVGMGCQFSTGEACSDKEAEKYLEDALDAIEYAIGGADTEWGAERVKAGHPDPYPLAYVEIGNENFGDLYDRRFDMFYAAIKAKYPQLTLISNHGINGMGKAHQTDMIDPHWYVNPEFFFNNTNIFDQHPRGKYTVYVGEYACNQRVGGGNMLAALSEAAFISGMERNSDLVKMTSYAPLFENRNDRRWPTNLIWISNNQVVGRSSYYVQQMYAENKPTYNLKTSAEIAPEPKVPFIEQEGYVGFGTWSTQATFRNLRITDRNGRQSVADLSDTTQWVAGTGEWSYEDNACTQTSDLNRTSLIWKDGKAGVGSTIEFEALKKGGKEGFQLYFGLQDTDLSKGYIMTIGGWQNVSSAFEDIYGDNSTILSEMIPEQVETGKWYKVKIVVVDDGADYYLNGKKVLSYRMPSLIRKFYVAGFDETNNEVIVKLINASDNACTAKINLTGGEVEPEGKVITLSAAAKTDENSFEEPFKIAPREEPYAGFSSSFNYVCQPNSFTVMRIKKK